MILQKMFHLVLCSVACTLQTLQF